MEQNNGSSKWYDLWAKIRKIKHFKLLVAILIAAIACLIYGGYSQKIKNASTATNVSITTNEPTSSLYSDTENKLAYTLSHIEGVGDAKVFISADDKENVMGVIVLAENAGDPVAEWQIRHAVQTTLKIDYHSIEVFSMK